ncbi:hypothetical protein C1G86_0944 [Dehalococcoides mccartyi]|uniref:Uncharacterized protein n=1 Tax=Dehalococcoides mccartyi TaxID=61435 RepID=A0A328ESG0_9CHLR|nr:hypothetical protein C1G86_0944 [Dehalococcoides mccartyi]
MASPPSTGIETLLFLRGYGCAAPVNLLIAERLGFSFNQAEVF